MILVHTISVWQNVGVSEREGTFMAIVSSRKSVMGFLSNAEIDAAGDDSTDRRIRLNDEQWRAFQEILDRPVADKPRLARLIAEKSVLE